MPIGARSLAALAAVSVLSVVAPGAALAQGQVTRDLEIPLSDGGHLLGDLYQPTAGGVAVDSLPTLVILFPYKKDDPNRAERSFVEAAVDAGFAALLVDLRGTGRSPGTFCLMCEREIQDGYELVEWAAAQSFSNGRIGMFGYSYPASVAARVAALAPPHLEAVVPASTFSDPYRDIIFPGGMLSGEDALGVGAVITAMAYLRGAQGTPFGEHAALLVDALTHPATVTLEAPLHDTYDDFWRERALENRVGAITAPALWLSGWDDVYVRGVPRNFLDATAAEHSALVMGPWGHLAQIRGDVDAFVNERALGWFDVFLRTDDPGERAAKLAAIPRILLFDVDPASPDRWGIWNGRWRSFSTWPPEHDDLVLSLCEGNEAPSPTSTWPVQGTLFATCDAAGLVPVVGAPLEATGPRSVSHDGDTQGFSDALDQRANVLATAFLGPELDSPVTLTGPAALELTAVTAGGDADWVARVVDVGPDGARIVAQGRLRASHRDEDPNRGYLWHTHSAPELVTPFAPYRLTIEIWPTSAVIPAGHRIGVLVQTVDTAKTLPLRPTPASFVMVGPGATTRVVLPVRTEHGTPVATP